MFETNWEYNGPITGIVDTGIIVIAHFENPIQDKMLDFLAGIFSANTSLLIPLTTFIGAYHILTSYLKVASYEAKNALLKTLNIEYDYFFPFIEKEIVIQSLDYSSSHHNIEAWDSYLISLGNTFNTNTIYTIDMKLKKIKTLNIISPVSNEDLQIYHQYIKTIIS